MGQYLINFTVLIIVVLRCFASKLSAIGSPLSFNSLTKNLIDGVYHPYSDKPHIGVQFVSTTDSLNVFKLNGDSILQVSNIVDGYRMLNVAGQTFLQQSVSLGTEQSVRDYAIPSNVELKFDNLDHVVSSLQDLPMHYHSLILQESVSRLAKMVEMKLFVQATIAMGTESLITGSDFPSALPMYTTAIQISQVFLANHSLSNPVSSHVAQSQIITNDDCLNDCPPCEDDLCLGMCGYSCYCWEWVCGDCCYHLGCYDHDVCCREKFIQTKCLFPLGFQCESEYSC